MIMMITIMMMTMATMEIAIHENYVAGDEKDGADVYDNDDDLIRKMVGSAFISLL